MPPPRVRPLLRARVALPRAALVRQLKGALAAPDAACIGRVGPTHAMLLLPPAQRHFWSPTLDLELVSEPEGVRLWGRFGPHPDVWVLFLGLYAVSTCSTIAGLVLGGSQALLGQAAWGLLVALGSALFGGLVTMASVLGQRLGRDQMSVIEDFLRATAGVPVEIVNGA